MKRLKYLVWLIAVSGCAICFQSFRTKEKMQDLHLTDKIYIIETDGEESRCIAYNDFGDYYTPIIDQTVFAVGYNKDFIICKRHPKEWGKSLNKKETFYYIIDVKSMIIDRKNFVPDTTIMNHVYKDITGKDSMGEPFEYITRYSPDTPLALSKKEYKNKRNELNLPDSLDFTLIYKKQE